MGSKRFKIRAAVYLIIQNDKGEVAMIRRFNTGYQDGKYTLPSGHIDEGESAKSAMTREANEEIGIQINPEDLEFAHIVHRVSLDNKIYADFYFHAKNWGETPSIKEPDKCDDLSWFKIDNLPKNIIPDVKLALLNFDKKVYYSEIGW